MHVFHFSATRIYIVVFSLILLSYLIFGKAHIKKYFQFVAIAFVFVVILRSFAPFRSGVISSWERVSQIEAITRGRYYEASTFDRRLSVRLPRLLTAFKRNWVLGWGFSNMYMEYQDQHVGNFNLLLQVGVAGFFVFVYFWVCYFRMILKARRRLRFENPYRNSLLVLVYVFAAMLVAHFTTFTFFGYTIGIPGALFVSILIALSEYLVREASGNDSVMHAA